MNYGTQIVLAASTLKACPFDGGKRLVVVKTARYDLASHPEWADDPDAYAYNVHCTTCAADGPWKKSQSSAEQCWNGVPGTERGGPLPGETQWQKALGQLRLAIQAIIEDYDNEYESVTPDQRELIDELRHVLNANTKTISQ